MKCKIYRMGEKEDILVRIEDREPECGRDFCDTCGECLVCGWDICYGHSGGHMWVKYEDELEDEE